MYEFIAREAPGNKIDEEYIQSIEHQFEFQFPPALKEYYLRYNGAQMYESPFICNGYRFCAIEILAMKVGTLPVETIIAQQVEAKDIPECYVPFALDEDYDYFYWNKNTGKVVYISREDADNPLPVCNGINEFFHILDEVRREGEKK